MEPFQNAKKVNGKYETPADKFWDTLLQLTATVLEQGIPESPGLDLRFPTYRLT
jgi:hypothetical protein